MLWVIVLIHLLITLIISGSSWMGKRNYQVGCIALCICMFFPVGGYIFTLIYLFKINKSMKVIEQDFFDEDILLFTERIQKRDTTSIVSMEETLLMNSNDIKRKKVSDILKEDPLEYIDILRMALKDKDTETSHYASSAISEVKRKLNLKLQKFNVEYSHAKEDITFLEEYATLLKTYLKSNLMDKYSHRRYSYLYLEVLKQLINLSPQKQAYSDLIEAYFGIGDLEKVSEYCKEFASFLECEESFMSKLKYFYTIRDNEKFLKTLNQLRNSSVSLSVEGLEKIRFWLEESYV